MIQLLHDTKINFMGARKWAYLFSSLIILVGMVSLVMKGGPRPGVDFAGGLLLDVRFSQAVRADDIRSALGVVGMHNAEIQAVEGGNDALIRVPQDEAPKTSGGDAISGPHRPVAAGVAGQPRRGRKRREFRGTKVGEAARQAAVAITVSVILIMIYISFRFHRWEFGWAARWRCSRHLVAQHLPCSTRVHADRAGGLPHRRRLLDQRRSVFDRVQA
jgi:preprotein translocase subunit SecF